MNNFEEPIKFSIKKDVSRDGKIFTYVVSNNTEVIAPYDGIVLFNHRTSTCNNFLGIEHIFNKERFYSMFCEVNPKSTITPNQMVVKGQIIGDTTDKDVTYTIINDFDKKQVINNFMYGKKYDKPSPEKKKKSDDNIITTTTTQRKGSEYKLPGEDKPGNIGMRLALAPFDYLQDVILKSVGARKKIKESEYDEKNKLIEEIERIKSLLK